MKLTLEVGFDTKTQTEQTVQVEIPESTAKYLLQDMFNNWTYDQTAKWVRAAVRSGNLVVLEKNH